MLSICFIQVDLGYYVNSVLLPSLPWMCVHIASSKPVACGLQFFLGAWFEWDSGWRIFALLCIRFKSHLRRSVFVFGAFGYTSIVSHWRPVCHVPKVPIPIVAENWHTYFVDKWSCLKEILATHWSTVLVVVFENSVLVTFCFERSFVVCQSGSVAHVVDIIF